jgi:4-amino-4-deoxy-L-arabinose transferase-like glycosyltransferase
MTAPTPGVPAVIAFGNRHHVTLTVMVLALAAFNLTFRLGSEIVTQWDESLYAITAWEMVDRGNWVGTTFLGTLDYCNTKPPLNVWLIALTFKAFGRGLVSLRLVSVLSAWMTVAVLLWWSRRWAGSTVALLAGLVPSTSFGFLYVHSGRSANTDAVFTLLILLTVVALWAAQDRPWHRVWLGPLLAAAFLLRGMAVLMPLAIVLAVEVLAWRRRRGRWIPSGVALLLFLVPVAAWMVARWQVDEWRFLERLFFYDFVARSIKPIERHPGSPLYYLNILQKHHYDWLLAGGVAWILFPVPWHQLRNLFMFWRGEVLTTLIVCWAGITFLMPTMMSTKVPWYLNTFYPVFALEHKEPGLVRVRSAGRQHLYHRVD